MPNCIQIQQNNSHNVDGFNKNYLNAEIVQELNIRRFTLSTDNIRLLPYHGI